MCITTGEAVEAIEACEANDYASQQEEINALRSQLRAAEATIARLSGPEAARDDFKDSRFPLFRRVQTALSRARGVPSLYNNEWM